MATACPSSVDECPACFKVLLERQVLQCGHPICLKCIKDTEDPRELLCPVCSAKTLIIKTRSRVICLSKFIPKADMRQKTIELIATFKVDQQPSSVAIDKAIRVIYVGRNDWDKPIEMFSYDGSYVGSVGDDIRSPRLAVDTLRGLLLAAAGTCIAIFGRDKKHMGTIQCPEFQHLEDIAYDVRQDKYIVVDIRTKCILFVDPDTHTVTRTLHAKEKDDMSFDDNDVCVASDKSGKTFFFAITDAMSHAVRLYDGHGLHFDGYKNKGSGYGQFNHPRGVSFNPDGQVVISDCDNHRLVCVSPEAGSDRQQWSVLMDTTEHKLRYPQDIDITNDGIMAVLFFTNPEKGPWKVAIFNTSA